MNVTVQRGQEIAQLKDACLAEKLRRFAAVSLLAPLALTACSFDSSGLAQGEADQPVCAAEGEPVTTLEERFCERTGDLIVVPVPDLEVSDGSKIDLTNDGKMLAVADYAADALRSATDGAVDLTPQVRAAPSGTADEIRSRNKGECVGIDKTRNFMGSVVEELMAGKVGFAQLAVIGGDSCPHSSGKIVGGVSGFTPEQDAVDVYATRTGGREYKEQTDITEVAGLLLHELLHNYGLGHAGYLQSNHPNAEYAFHQDPTGKIDLDTYLADVEYMVYGQYGNVMSSDPLPLQAGVIKLPHEFLNELQIEHLEYGINPEGVVSRVLPFETGSVLLDIENDNAPVGVSIELENVLKVGTKELSHVNFLVIKDAKGIPKVEIIASTRIGADELLTLATVAQIELEEERPLFVSIGGHLVTIRWDGERAVVTSEPQ